MIRVPRGTLNHKKTSIAPLFHVEQFDKTLKNSSRQTAAFSFYVFRNFRHFYFLPFASFLAHRCRVKTSSNRAGGRLVRPIVAERPRSHRVWCSFCFVFSRCHRCALAVPAPTAHSPVFRARNAPSLFARVLCRSICFPLILFHVELFKISS